MTERMLLHGSAEYHIRGLSSSRLELLKQHCSDANLREIIMTEWNRRFPGSDS